MARKGQKPSIKDNSEIHRLKHKLIDKWCTTENHAFFVVRQSNLKTTEYSGMFWEHDWTRLKSLKSQGKRKLCASVPRIEERIRIFISHIRAMNPDPNITPDPDAIPWEELCDF